MKIRSNSGVRQQGSGWHLICSIVQLYGSFATFLLLSDEKRTQSLPVSFISPVFRLVK